MKVILSVVLAVAALTIAVANYRAIWLSTVGDQRRAFSSVPGNFPGDAVGATKDEYPVIVRVQE
jgi:hypothetical protein